MKIIILINFAYFLLLEILGFLNVLEKMVLNIKGSTEFF